MRARIHGWARPCWRATLAALGAIGLLWLHQIGQGITRLQADLTERKHLMTGHQLLLTRLHAAERRCAQAEADTTAARQQWRILEAELASLHQRWIAQLAAARMSPVLTAEDGRHYTVHGWPRLSLMRLDQGTLVLVDPVTTP
jgi:hypothetical protein